MRTNRPVALLGAAGALAGPATAIALADEPAAPATPDTLRANLGDRLTVRADMRGHQHNSLVRRHRSLSHTAGERHAGARFWSNGHLRRDITRLRRELRARESSTSSSGAALSSIAACESGGNPRAIGGGGAFRGKYQFTVPRRGPPSAARAIPPPRRRPSRTAAPPC